MNSLSFRKKKPSDLARMDGKRFTLDRFLTIICFLILSTVVILPVIMIIYNTFWDGTKIDFGMFARVIFREENLSAMRNTLVISVCATTLATAIGVFFAWLLGRSDIPLKGIMRWLFSIPFMIPPFLGAMAWDMMFSARGGYITRWVMSTFGLSKAPFNINSVGGIILIMVVYYFPFVYLQVVSALERMDPTLEESARIAGARQMYVIRKITLPLTVPAISSGMLMVLITSLSNYGIPAMLGFSQNIFTLPTKIVDLMNRAGSDFQGIREATALSVILVITVSVALLVQRKLLSARRYDIIKGKSMRPTLIKLRGARYPLMVLSLVFLALVVLAPLVTILLISFVKAYGLPLIPENFSLANYQRILVGNTMVSDAVKNSLFLGFGAGLTCLFLGVMLSYVIYRIRPKGRGVLEVLAVLPYSLPGTVLSVGCILAWSGAFFGITLYNSIWIIMVAYIARYLTYTLKSCSASLQQVHPSLEEAARACGATHLQSLWDVTVPLIKPAMVSGFFLVFLPAMRELTTSVLLYGPKSRTLGVAIYQLRINGQMAPAAALSVLMIIIVMTLNTLVKRVTKDRKGI